MGVRSRRGPELSKKTLLAEEQRRPDVARKRARWKAHQGRLAPSRLKFLDETNMAPPRGWGTRGRRLKAYVPHGHFKTLTFIAALRSGGTASIPTTTARPSTPERDCRLSRAASNR